MTDPNIKLIPVLRHDDVDAVKAIFEDYAIFIKQFLGQSACSQGLEDEFADFPQGYRQLFLARIDGEPVAACGLKAFTPETAELKRLYCRPEGRGHGLGRKLTALSIEWSRAAGFTQMYLDTDPGLKQACAIYEDLGFKDIERYYDKEMGCSRYMALTL